MSHSGSARALGARCCWFDSSHPDDHGGVREQENPADCGSVFDGGSTRTPPQRPCRRSALALLRPSDAVRFRAGTPCLVMRLGSQAACLAVETGSIPVRGAGSREPQHGWCSAGSAPREIATPRPMEDESLKGASPVAIRCGASALGFEPSVFRHTDEAMAAERFPTPRDQVRFLASVPAHAEAA